MKKSVIYYEKEPSFLTPQKVIVVLLILAIVFSIGSTLINLSLLNFDFKPIRDIFSPQGNPQGNVRLVIEGDPTSNVP